MNLLKPEEPAKPKIKVNNEEKELPIKEKKSPKEKVFKKEPHYIKHFKEFFSDTLIFND